MDQLDRDGKLPTAFRGYDREAVDRLLGEIEESYRALLSERDGLRAKLEDTSRRLSKVTADLDERAGRERAIADALIEAERLKAGAAGDAADTRGRAEREAQELRAAAEGDAAGIRREAELKAETIVRDAEAAREQAGTEAGELLRSAQARADRLVDEMQQSLEERQHRAEEVLDDAKVRLGSLVRDLFGRAGAASEDRDSWAESEQGSG